MLTGKICVSRDGFALLAAIVLVLLSPSLFSAAFDEPGVVKAKAVVAQAFVLRGAGGNRISAILQGSDRTSLWFDGGDRYLAFGTENRGDGALGVKFYKARESAVAVGLDSEGTARIRVGEKDAGPQLELAADKQLGQFLSIKVGAGKQEASLFSSNRGPGSAQLSLYGRNGVRRLALVHGSRPTALVLTDANNQMRAKMGMFPERPPELVLFAAGSSPRLELSQEATGEAVIKLHDVANQQVKVLR
jgi:hypothetical protein